MIPKKIKTEETFGGKNHIKQQIKTTSKKSITSLKMEKGQPLSRRLTHVRKNQHTATTIESPSSSLNYAHKKLMGKSKSKINKISSKWKSQMDSNSVECTLRYQPKFIDFSMSYKTQEVYKQSYNQLLRRSKHILDRYSKELKTYKQENRQLKEENNQLKNLYRTK